MNLPKIAFPWKTWLLLIAVLAAGVFLWNRERGLRAGAERGREAAELALRNQIVEKEQSEKQLREGMSALLKRDSDLQDAYEAALRAAPGARPVSTSQLDTGPMQVHTHPRVAPPSGAAGGAVTPSSPTAPPPSPLDQPICVLTDADKLGVRVTQIELLTKANNTVVVGTAQAYRDAVPPEVLASGPFRSVLSSSGAAVPDSVTHPPGWGAMVLGTLGPGGVGLGGAVLFPPATLPLVGWRVEGLAGVLALPGSAAAVGGLGTRW